MIKFLFLFHLTVSFPLDILIKFTDKPEYDTAHSIISLHSANFSLTSPSKTICVTLNSPLLTSISSLKSHLFAQIPLEFLPNEYLNLFPAESESPREHTANQTFFEQTDFFKAIDSQSVPHIAVLDSGVSSQPCSRRVENVNMTDETASASNDHGELITSLICSKRYGLCKECQVFSFKIFTKGKKTKPSFIFKALDAIKATNIKIVNLSFGGVDFKDLLIKDKLNELAEKGVVLVAASGNDGPSYGSINFPGAIPGLITVCY